MILLKVKKILTVMNIITSSYPVKRIKEECVGSLQLRRKDGSNVSFVHCTGGEGRSYKVVKKLLLSGTVLPKTVLVHKNTC